MFGHSWLVLIQVFFAVVIGLYFLNLLRGQQGSKVAVQRESRKEVDKLKQLRSISLSMPLSEMTRPADFSEIIGQDEGLRALRAALCGPNPQHVIIYGPPGIGKTAAARLILEEAKKNPASPFSDDAKFVEIDATTARFDERGIADPLIGSVHDPIYQGAGPMGMAGIPQPKPGAVTKAHGGILFIDEIGELHPVQMNKLLKVLEDRKVFFESAYYNSEDTNIPSHIHDIFENGLPADFRLVGATTKGPQDIPPAIRSRCLEVYFRPLLAPEIAKIARNAARKVGYQIADGAVEVICRFAGNGREAVNIVQLAAGLAYNEDRKEIRRGDIEWVVSSGQYTPRLDKKIPASPRVGYANGLAVTGPNTGILIEVEVSAVEAKDGRGTLTITGIIEEEELGGAGRVVRRTGTAKGSIENVLTVLSRYNGLNPRSHDIHVNFPGGIPIDGPSAGVTVAVGIYSAITGLKVDNKVAMTGELSIHGHVKPIGGVMAKIDAAVLAGAKRVLIPADNWQEMFAERDDIEIVTVKTLDEVLKEAIIEEEKVASGVPAPAASDLTPASAAKADMT